MNKKLIVVAIAAAVAAPAAMAGDTTMYGKAHVDLRSHEGPGADSIYVNSNSSRLGVKGSEDLGNGLSAIFKYESTVDISDGGSNGGTFGAARNAYVGLSGGFGTVLMGRHDTPAKVAFYAAGNDHLGDSVIDFNRIGFEEYRVDNAIAYISPSFSGFTVAGAVVPGENANTAAGTDDNGLADAYSLGLIYGGHGLKASVGYEVAEGNMVLQKGGAGIAIGAKDHAMFQAGASYTFGDFTVGGQYENTSDMAGIAGRDYTVWGLAGKANFGNNFVVINGGQSKDKSTTTVETTTIGIGAGHKFSKRTQVYVAYSNQDPDNATDTTEMSLGMIHNF